MQVQIKKEPRVFKPVTLEITFETLEELKMLDDMLSWNVSIPEIVYEHKKVQQEELLKLMTKIHEQVIIAAGG